MPVAGLTYGLELEWADTLRSLAIPKDLGSWNLHEDTIVNSDGTSNDQMGDRGGKGGEINTVPSESKDRQVEIARSLITLFTDAGCPPTVNYKCAMHVHVGYYGIQDDLDRMKALMKYVSDYQVELLWSTFKLSEPKVQSYESIEDYKFAVEYFRKYTVPYRAHFYHPEVVSRALSSKSPEEFFDVIRPIEDEFDETDRSYINLSSIEKNGTVEFRQFSSTTDSEQVRDAIDWCEAFVTEALGGARHPLEFMSEQYYNFPEQKHIDPKLETAYRKDYLLNATGEHADRLRAREAKWR
jgi:hypothetical protein